MNEELLKELVSELKCIKKELELMNDIKMDEFAVKMHRHYLVYTGERRELTWREEND